MAIQDIPWVVEDKRTNVLAAGLGALLLGILMIALGSHLKGASGGDSSIAGTMLVSGVFIIGGGLWLLVAMPRETTTVDPNHQRIVITRKSRFGERDTVIRFSQIQKLTCESSGSPDDGPETFLLIAHLSNGQQTQLFAKHYEGSGRRDVAERHRQRLGAMIIAACPEKVATLLPTEQGLMDRLSEWTRRR